MGPQVPGNESVLACRVLGAGSQRQGACPVEVTRPAGVLGLDPPFLVCREVVNYFAISVATTFFFFRLFWKHSLGFSLLWFSLCFHNLSASGWSGFRQAATSAGSHRVHVLMEEMWPEPKSLHPRKGSDSYPRWRMYGLYP